MKKFPSWVGGIGFIVVAIPIVVWAIHAGKASGGAGGVVLVPAILALLALNAFVWMAVCKRG